MSLRPDSRAKTRNLTPAAAAGVRSEARQHLDCASLDQRWRRARGHLEIWCHTDAVDRTAGRSEVVAHRQLQRRSVRELARRLDAALTERLAADDDRATAVLLRRRDDLRRARRTAVDEY